MAEDLECRVNGTSGGLDEHTCDDMAAQSQLPGGVARGKTNGRECLCMLRGLPPEVPEGMPYQPDPSNVMKLQEWILEQYKASAFNTCECQALPRMHGEPLVINVTPGAKPVASHSPIPVPLHWQKEVKAQLDRDVKLGVIEQVPSGTDTTWCHRMVIVAKKDGSPRRTINFQPLNALASRQTHHTPPPFIQASSVPAGTWKTVMDAWNGYHSVALAPELKDLT